MSAPRMPASRNKRPRRKRGNGKATLDAESLFLVDARSACNGELVPDYALERRAWATDKEPTRSASPPMARLGSTSGAVCGAQRGSPACARGTAVSDRERARNKYFSIVFTGRPFEWIADRLRFEQDLNRPNFGVVIHGKLIMLCHFDFLKVTMLNSLVPRIKAPSQAHLGEHICLVPRTSVTPDLFGQPLSCRGAWRFFESCFGRI